MQKRRQFLRRCQCGSNRLVYSDALRQRMQELFADETGRGGDAIPSAIDFTIDLQRGVGKAGEPRIIITLDAKYLEYREF
jgi:cyanate lyase